MARQRRAHFSVRGQGRFPIDMLRYDGCFPFQSSDSGVIEASLREPVSAEVRTVRLESESVPTAGLWASFGWRVVQEGL